jgi:hypothetical protein
MIIHAALYTFRSDISQEQIAVFIQELKAVTRRTGLVIWFLCGQHLPLPADQNIREQVYDFAALWGFANQQALDDFSQHPAIIQCVTRTIQPVLDKLAIVNFSEMDEIYRLRTKAEEYAHVS